MTKNGLPKGQDMASIFWSKEYRAKSKFDEEIAELRADQREINTLLDALKNEGIVQLNHDKVMAWHSKYEIDMYKLMETWCAENKRPYIKCVRTSYDRIMLKHVGTGPARGLLTPLLLAAEPIKADTKFVSNSKKAYTIEQVLVDPDFENNVNITYSDADVRHWVTQRSITILFQGAVGERKLREWREFIRNSRVNLMLLGVFK